MCWILLQRKQKKKKTVTTVCFSEETLVVFVRVSSSFTRLSEEFLPVRKRSSESFCVATKTGFFFFLLLLFTVCWKLSCSRVLKATQKPPISVFADHEHTQKETETCKSTTLDNK